MGTKGRPFYRVVVAKSTAGRNSSFVESIGTYDPQSKPKHMQIDEARALHWLSEGAQPTETTAYLLNKLGILEKHFEARPKARKSYSFLDKRTSAMSVKSAIEAPAAKAEKKAAAVEEPAVEPTAEVEAVVEAPETVAEEAPVADEPTVEAADVAEEAAPETAVEEPADEAPLEEPESAAEPEAEKSE